MSLNLPRLKHELRDIAASLLHWAGVTTPRNPARLFIVTFHRVLPSEVLASYAIPEIAVTPEELAWFTGLFSARFECGTLGQMHERWAAGERFHRTPLAVTFDDGQLDNFMHALPVLERAGVAATFFVPTDAIATGMLLWHDRAVNGFRIWLERDRAAALRVAQDLGCPVDTALSALPGAVMRALKALDPAQRGRFVFELEERSGGSNQPAWDGMMSTEHLRELARRGHEVGSHSRSHALLPALGDEQLKDELTGSRAWLESELDRPVSSFCYPNGDADDRVVRATRAAGYRRAVTTRWGWNPRGADPFRLTRCSLESETSRTAGGGLSWSRVAWRLSGLHPGLG